MENQYFTKKEVELINSIAVKATKEKAFQVLSYVLIAHVDGYLHEAIMKDFEEELTKELE